MAETEFRHGRFEATCAVARLIRKRAPDEPEPHRLLALVAPCLPKEGPSHSQRADYHLALAEAHRMLGDNELAASNYRWALTFNGNLLRAHVGLATIRMSGDFYHAWLDRFYMLLSPKTVVEIGINDGASLARAQPPTIAIGVDPNPSVIYPLTAETHIFPKRATRSLRARDPTLWLDIPWVLASLMAFIFMNRRSETLSILKSIAVRGP